MNLTMLRKAIRRSFGAPSMWRMQYASGLRAGHSWQRAWSMLVPGAAPRLALLGNCGSIATPAEGAETAEFLTRCANTYESVSVILGPEELRTPWLPYPYTMDAWRKLVERMPNVSILDQGEVYDSVRDVCVLGATGWTPAIGMQEIPEDSVEGGIRHLEGEGPLTPTTLGSWHTEDLRWIRERLDWWATHRPTVRTVVLTHHLCSGHLVPLGATRKVYRRIPLDVMPADATKEVLRAPNLAAWLCGAGGSCTSGVFGGRMPYVAANCFLAAGEWQNPAYLPSRVLEIPPRAGGGGDGVERVPVASALGFVNFHGKGAAARASSPTLA